MKKLFVLSVLSFVVLLSVQAQPKELVIKKGSRGLYLEHSVAPKEGLYAIGRLYNVHPKYIAAYNQVDINKGLSIDQVIHIPLTDTNFTQKSNKGTPVYYAVIEAQGLMKVSNAVNKVPLKDLRSWNSIKNDNLPAGSKLIVGFLVSKEMAAVASKSPVKQTSVKQEDKPVAKSAQPTAAKAEEEPVVKTQVKQDQSTKTAQPEVKESAKTIAEEAKPVVKTSTETGKEIAPEVNEEAKKTEAVFAKQETVATVSEQGYFKKSFEQQVKSNPASKNATVTSGIFKTTSGWQDAKYYLLIDGVPTGTIVKVTNPGNNLAVYAKVLGEMNGIRQNEGYDIRISNAAASTLGIAVSDTDKFIVKVNY